MQLKYFILGNICFVIFLFLFATDQDFSGLSKDPYERFVGLMYFVMSTLTTIGYGDVLAISMRARIVIMLYMAFIFSILVLNFSSIKFNFK
jgi:hypothetical protein